ncbi:MAG TPA: AAA family ATPase [Solirubrobacterales bacterium]
MKLTQLEIDGFRCFREKKVLAFKEGRSLCLLAENGRGKSSIADALEFWSTGDVGWTHRDGVGLGALIHLDRNDAVVEVRVDGVGVGSRNLRGRKAGPLVAGAGPLAVNFQSERLPILPHRTMAGFVNKTANDKRTELLEALGLEELSDFRRGVRSAAQKLKRLQKETIQQLLEAERAWQEELRSEALPTILEQLSRHAQLDSDLKDEADLAGWAPKSSHQQPSGNVLALAQELADADKALREAPLDLWASAVADRAAAEQRSLSVLLEAGQAVVQSSDEDRCPLCLVEQDRDQLLEQVVKRAAELAAITEKFHRAEDQIQQHQLTVNRLIRAVEGYLASGHPNLSEDESDLELSRKDLADHAKALDVARRNRSALPGAPPGIGKKILARLHRDAIAAPADIGPAMLQLSKLKGQLETMTRARALAVETNGKLDAAEAAADIADETVERAVQLALDRINEPLAAYYGLLVGQSVYSDLQLTYTEGRAGGIEFEFKWDGRHHVRPPQKIMSESELNALGLALFLARIKTDAPAWRTMVLDDVIASFDSVHQTRLVRLLNAEFGDWQVLLLTHDRQLSQTVQAEAPAWLLEKVTAWTPQEGPSFGSASMRTRLKERLDAGEPAEELGGLARQAMEEALERPVRKLGLKIRHDPNNVYSADEYRRALVDGLADGGFPRAEDSILNQLRTDGSTSNRACHFRDHEPSVSEQDLRVLLEDLEALDQLFHCDNCEKKVWQVPHKGSSRCQCQCGELSCA